MDITELVNLVGSLGFPIAMSCYLLWYMGKQDEKHDAEVSKLRDIVEKNTEALISLKETIAHTVNKKDGP